MIIRFIRFLLLVGLIYALYKWLFKGEKRSANKRNNRGDEVPPNHSNNTPPTDTVPKIIAEMKKDPVCGTYIPENQAVICEIQGTTHYFCSDECKLKFQELPNQ